jgi:S1-C subfamily serine protease
MTPKEEALDLAVLQVSNPRLPKDVQPLSWSFASLSANQRVYVIGHPLNKGEWDSASGDIPRFDPYQPTLSINATVAQGNSGGPVINEQNQVIGLFIEIRGRNAVSIDATRDMPNLKGIEPATGDVGLAHPIEIVIQKLKAWKILD